MKLNKKKVPEQVELTTEVSAETAALAEYEREIIARGEAHHNGPLLLSARDVTVRFNLRGAVLTAIRGASLDVYEGETLAIVGE